MSAADPSQSNNYNNNDDDDDNERIYILHFFYLAVSSLSLKEREANTAGQFADNKNEKGQEKEEERRGGHHHAVIADIPEREGHRLKSGHCME